MEGWKRKRKQWVWRRKAKGLSVDKKHTIARERENETVKERRMVKEDGGAGVQRDRREEQRRN